MNVSSTAALHAPRPHAPVDAPVDAPVGKLLNRAELDRAGVYAVTRAVSHFAGRRGDIGNDVTTEITIALFFVEEIAACVGVENVTWSASASDSLDAAMGAAGLDGVLIPDGTNEPLYDTSRIALLCEDLWAHRRAAMPAVAPSSGVFLIGGAS